MPGSAATRAAKFLSPIDEAVGPEHIRNMPHAYTIEVWDENEVEILETISIATDVKVSDAAWCAAARVRPGFLLIHKNGDRVMEKLIAPGNRPADGQLARSYVKGLAGVDIMLSELREWHQVVAICSACVRNAALNIDGLRRQFGGNAFFGDVEKRLVCRRCGGRDTVRLRVVNAPRD